MEFAPERRLAFTLPEKSVLHSFQAKHTRVRPKKMVTVLKALSVIFDRPPRGERPNMQHHTRKQIGQEHLWLIYIVHVGRQTRPPTNLNPNPLGDSRSAGAVARLRRLFRWASQCFPTHVLRYGDSSRGPRETTPQPLLRHRARLSCALDQPLVQHRANFSSGGGWWRSVPC